MTPFEQLHILGLKLPSASTPGGNYVSVNVRGNVAYVAIQFPIQDGEFLYQGRLGAGLTTEEGYEAMRLCALNVLAQVHYKVGFERLVGVNHLEAYYRAVDSWDEAPKVVDGASDLLVHVLGERGIHTRSISGVHHLPRNFSVGLTASVTVKPF